MDESKIMKKDTPGKTVPINIKITKALSDWLKEKKYSPTGIFEESCKDLGFKEKD